MEAHTGLPIGVYHAVYGRCRHPQGLSPLSHTHTHGGASLAGCVCAQVRAAGRRVVRVRVRVGRCEKPVQSNLTRRTTGCMCAGEFSATLSSLSTHTAIPDAAKMNTRASLDGHTGHAHAPLGAHAHVHSGQHGVILGHVHTQQTNHLICCEAGRAGACPVC
jgi:hypothetical protein